MDASIRNDAFDECQTILRGCVKRNYPLIKALNLEVEDVIQDLSLRMLRAIPRFDSDRCRSLPFFLYHELQHEILDMRKRHKPHGIVGVPMDSRVEIVYLDQPQENGAQLEISVDADFNFTNEAIETLPDAERSVLMRKMSGEAIRKKKEREHLAKAREILADYFSERVCEYA